MSPQNPAGPASAWLWATPAVPFALKPEGSESVQTFRLVSSPRGGGLLRSEQCVAQTKDACRLLLSTLTWRPRVLSAGPSLSESQLMSSRPLVLPTRSQKLPPGQGVPSLSNQTNLAAPSALRWVNGSVRFVFDPVFI